MSIGTVIMTAILLLILVTLFRYCGILFIMMLIIEDSVNRRPFGSTPVKLRLIDSADVKSSCPPVETLKESPCGLGA